MPDTTVNALHVLSHLFLKTTLWGWSSHKHLHFMDEEIEAPNISNSIELVSS